MFLLRPSLRPQLHALGWLAGLLLSKLSSAAVASPWMCYKGFLGVTSCLHNSLGLAKSFAALKTHSFTDQPCLTQVPCPASSASCSCWVGCFATLSWLHWRAGLVYTRALPCVLNFMLLLGSLVCYCLRCSSVELATGVLGGATTGLNNPAQFSRCPASCGWGCSRVKGPWGKF